MRFGRALLVTAWDISTKSMKNITQFFPPWTVTRDVWQAALRPDVSGIAVDARLFHEAGCRLVHKYQLYKDPFRRPAYPATYFGFYGSGTCGMISGWYACTGTDESSTGYVC